MAVYLGKNKVDMIGGQPTVIEGTTPTGTINITSNGTHNVTNYASANVNVPSAGIDTSDATATAADMAEGVTAYVDGEKITGSLRKRSLNSYLSSDTHWYNGNVHLKRVYDTEFICEKPSNLSYVPVDLCEKGSAFGDAESSCVLKDKTFTSASGLKIAGSIPYIPYANNDANNSTTIGITKSDEEIEVEHNGRINFKYNFTSPYAFLEGSSLTYSVVASEFGNARPEDVASGVTFTSSKGLKLTGTATIGSSSGGYSSGDVVKAYPTNYTFVSGYVSGNITISYANNAGADSDEEGKVELRGDDNSGISSGLTVSSATSCDPVKGKYITVKSGNTTSDVFYIPEDATFTYSGQSYNKTFSVDKCSKVFIIA